MKIIRKIFCSVVLGLLLASCSGRDYIRLESPNAIGFQFFLFADLQGEKIQGNGDAVLVRDEYFHFRLYDNLLNKYVLAYLCRSDGQQFLTLPLEKSVMQKYDPELSKILVKNFYSLIKGELIYSQKDDTIKDIVFEDNLLKKVIFHYSDWELSLEVLKRQQDGTPIRFRLMSGEDNLIFDIIRYQPLSFRQDKQTAYRHYQVQSEKPFLKWIGEVYGGQ